MRRSKLLCSLLLVLALPACLRAADVHCGCSQHGVDTTWIGDCGRCDACSTRFLPALAGGFTRLLDDVFRCPVCRDHRLARSAARAPTTLASIRYSGLVRDVRNLGGCDRCHCHGRAHGLPTPIEMPTARVDKKSPPPGPVRHAEEQIDTRPRSTRLISKPPRPSRREIHKPARRAPRPLTVTTATWINKERELAEPQDNAESKIRKTSDEKPARKIPHNPLRDAGGGRESAS